MEKENPNDSSISLSFSANPDGSHVVWVFNEERERERERGERKPENSIDFRRPDIEPRTSRKTFAGNGLASRIPRCSPLSIFF